MLQQLRLKNFKSLKKAQVDFGRITVLIGPNGTGKSSICQALMVLRQSSGSSELHLSGPLISLEDFEDVLTKEAPEREIGIGLSFGIGSYPDLDITGDVSYSYDACFDPHLISFDTAIGNPHQKYLVAKMERDGPSIIKPPELMPKGLKPGLISVKLATQREIAEPFRVASSTCSHGLEREGAAFYKKIKELISVIKQLVTHMHPVPAVRGFNEPYPLLAEHAAIDFRYGRDPEAASTFAYAGEDTQRLISKWSASVTGSKLASRLLSGRKVIIESDAAPGGIPVTGDGFGTNQLAQLFIKVAVTPRQSLLTIEEPEIHLHPAAQEKLCGVLVETAKAQDKQIILTTHSEHILYSFLSAVRNGTLTRDELAIYNFEEKGKEPCQIGVDEYGEIDEWRRHFFSQS